MRLTGKTWGIVGMTRNHITTKATTTKATAVLLSGAINGAWWLISIGEQAYARLDAAPVWIPAVLWRMRRSVVAAAEALETLAERTAERRGIDILAVLAPIVDARLDVEQAQL
jgi:hypothetical protein